MNLGDHFAPPHISQSHATIPAALDALCQQTPGIPPEDITRLMEILERLMQDCSQSNIQAGKIWVIDHCTTPPQYEHFVRLLGALAISRSAFADQLHLVYLINDLLAHSDRKQEHWIKHAMQPQLPFLLRIAYHFPGANDSQRQSVLKVLDIWRQRHIYDPRTMDSILSAVTQPEGPGPIGPQGGHGMMPVGHMPGFAAPPLAPQFPIHQAPPPSAFYLQGFSNPMPAPPYGFNEQLPPPNHHQGFPPHPTPLAAGPPMMPLQPHWGGAPPPPLPAAPGAVPYQHQASPPRPQPHLNPHAFPHAHAPQQPPSQPTAPVVPEVPAERMVRTADMRAGTMVTKVNVKDGYYATLPPEMLVSNHTPPPSQAVQEALKDFESMSAMGSGKGAAVSCEGWTSGYIDVYLKQVAQKVEAARGRGQTRRKQQGPSRSRSRSRPSRSASRSRSRSRSRERRGPLHGRARSKSRHGSRSRSASRGRSRDRYRSRGRSRSMDGDRGGFHFGSNVAFGNGGGDGSGGISSSSSSQPSSEGARFYPPPAF